MKYSTKTTIHILISQLNEAIRSFKMTEQPGCYASQKYLRAVALMELYNAMSQAGFFDEYSINIDDQNAIDRSHALAQESFTNCK